MKSHCKKRILLPVLTGLCVIVLFLCHQFHIVPLRMITDSIAAVFSPNQDIAEPSEINDPDTECSNSESPSDSVEQDVTVPPIPEDPAQPQDQAATPPLLDLPAVSCDPALTELQTKDDLQVLTGGSVNVVYYLQGDERWGDLLYGSDKISTHGCGPTAMAIVVSTLTNTVIDPPSMAEWAVEHGYWARGSGSYHRIVIGTADAFGLKAEPFYSRDPNALREQFFAGNLFVALMGPGHFTQGGHFIILRGVTLSGDILVADPASVERSLTVWDAQLLLDELSTSTVDGSPLWLISLPEGFHLE